MSDDTTQPFVNTICSICHEHLKPIVENLQAISICGHVFHELCIQQWFEYCSKGKKKCPICKQTCSAANVSRLYFQSLSDSNDPNLSQKLQTHKEDPEELKLEVRRLEGKINVLNSALECRDNDLENIRNELSVCEEQLKKEASAKKDAMVQTKTINDLLGLKTKELKQSDLKCKESDMKCTKLQERNLSLAKELAALKLVSDLDLEEEEIVKFASLATEPQSHSNNSVNILKKSLAVRNKLYKELINKFKALSSKESRSCKELEKANKQLKELKGKIKTLETAKIMKGNVVLRAPKASKKTKCPKRSLNEVDPALNDTCTPQDTTKEPDIHLGKTKRLRECENINDSVPQPTKRASNDTSYPSKNLPETSEHNGFPWYDCEDDDVVFPYESVTKDSSTPVFNPQEAGGFFFSNGLLDATNKHPSKWCKKGQSKAASGDLIAVGADGRGGTTKVLKSPNLPSLNYRGSSNSAKTRKLGAKASSLQSQGLLQINHFFSKVGQ